MAGRDHEDCSQSPISDPLSSPLEDDQGGGGWDHEVLQLRRARRSPPRAIRTTDPSVGVDRVIDGSGGLEAEPPVTVGTMFKSVVNRVPDRPALCYKEGGAWKTITFARYYGLCMAAAKSFVKVYGAILVLVKVYGTILVLVEVYGAILVLVEVYGAILVLGEVYLY